MLVSFDDDDDDYDDDNDDDDDQFDDDDDNVCWCSPAAADFCFVLSGCTSGGFHHP